MTSRDVIVGGARSLVRQSGPASGPEGVVFVHGNPGSSEDWSDLLPRVGAFTRAIAPDMPGFGKAGRPADFAYTVEGYARHLAGVLDQLSLERVHLVLHDFGGPWGLVWAAMHPKAVASVTLVNIGIMPGYKWHKFARIWQTPLLGELSQLLVTRRAFRKMMDAENPKPFPRAFVDRMYDDMDRGTKRAVLKLYRASIDLEASTRKVAEAIGPLKLPALVLWGAGDTFLPLRFAEVQRHFFAVSAVHVLEGCGHWPFIDEAERCADLIVPFLRQQIGSPAPVSRERHVG